ncbi:hypothetical protein ANANG_G00299150 [Anguilla anguilla]|uniref:Protein kinase domain-containing protein n=1 Tax=Anguilla anguilla TaxID=7936 RepID=A0A9D3LJ89_ANGAN|nr:hypothetical protein ANANG_G00299150 [Anguilla anguilla]
MCENTRAMENLEDKICAFLKRKEAGAPLKALEIAKGVGLKTAKDVNKALYSLQGKGRLQKVGDSPPLWSLGGPSRSAAVNDTPNPTGTPSKHKIKTILKSHTGREGVTVKELARDLNQPSRAVNAQLYDMLSRGEVEKSRLSKDGSFSWKCTDEDGSNNNSKLWRDAPGDSITSTVDESSDSDTSVSTFSWFQKNYSSVKKLGEGGFGSVFIAKKKIDETDYAIKVVEFDKHASREVKALAHFNHPNIVRYFTAWEESSPPQSSESGE